MLEDERGLLPCRSSAAFILTLTVPVHVRVGPVYAVGIAVPRQQLQNLCMAPQGCDVHRRLGGAIRDGEVGTGRQQLLQDRKRESPGGKGRGRWEEC